MKNKLIFLLAYFSIMFAQELPSGTPKYFQLDSIPSIFQINVSGPSSFPRGLIHSIDPISYLNEDIYFLEIQLDDLNSFHFSFLQSPFPDGMTLYLIDMNTQGWVGPYTREIVETRSIQLTGQMKSRRILVEFSVPIDAQVPFPLQEIFLPERPDNFEETLNPGGPPHREENPTILLCGYWPPSNECIRPFSKNPLINADGWQGQNWENLGYDIISFFPNFTPPDCENCGQGQGDFEVDYQDTSTDWWNILDTLNPVAIITFSRGYIDYSWEMEWKYYNRLYWVPDYTEPLYPTPIPPDSTVEEGAIRYSSLPMDSIVSAIESADLGLNPYIDYSDGAGGYLSEFLGYHGVWYKAKMDSLNLPCYTAGHVHVGGLIDWETAQEAAKVTLREVIKLVEEFQELPGDINEDNVVSILDLLLVIFHVLGISELNEGQWVLADVNFDLIVDIYDLIRISNIILDY